MQGPPASRKRAVLRPKAAAGTKPAAAPRIYTLAELPAAVRRQVPPLDLSLHYYTAAPTARLIRLNGNLLREGEVLTPSVRVVAITPHGVILSCAGFRFRLVEGGGGGRN